MNHRYGRSCGRNSWNCIGKSEAPGAVPRACGSLFGFVRGVPAQLVERHAEGVGKLDGNYYRSVVVSLDVLDRSDRDTGAPGQLRNGQPCILADGSKIHFLTSFTIFSASGNGCFFDALRGLRTAGESLVIEGYKKGKIKNQDILNPHKKYILSSEFAENPQIYGLSRIKQ